MNRKPTIEELNRLRERERQLANLPQSVRKLVVSPEVWLQLQRQRAELGIDGVQWFSVGDDGATPSPDESEGNHEA